MISSRHPLHRLLPAVALLFVLLLAGFASGSFRALEEAAYSFGMEVSAPRRASERFAVLMLDDAARKSVGEWPWSGPEMRRLLQALDDAGVRGVAWNLPMVDAATPATVAALDSLESQLAGDAAGTLAELRARVQPNDALADGLRAVPGSLLAIPQLEDPDAAADGDIAESLTRWRLDFSSRGARPLNMPDDLVPPRMPLAGWLDEWRSAPDLPDFAPAKLPPSLLDAASGVGLQLVPADFSRYPLVGEVNGQLLPSLPLRMAMLATDAQRGSLWLLAGEGAALGRHWISTDREANALPYFYPLDGPGAIERFSIADVLAGALPRDALQGRVVLLGSDLEPLVTTPRSDRVHSAVALSQVAASFYAGDVYATPWWVAPARWFAWLLVGAWLLLAVPRMDWRWAALGSVVFAVVLINIELLLLISQSTWMPLSGPVLALAVGHVVLALQRRWLHAGDEQRRRLSLANLELGKDRRSHGQLDRAFEALRQCEPEEAALEQLHDLAHDYERRQHFAKALKVFRHIKKTAPATPEIDQRINRLQRLEEQSLRHRKHPIDIEPGETRDPRNAPMLGRFSILEEIARGSMGVVYRGQDARIGRDVAVKTLALQNEFEGEKLEEVQARFFREAEAAGRLSHPNIVTIYDVGEEEGLAYIAMDFLKGPSLAAHAKENELLPLPRVLDLVARVADALQAAHDQNVIHRDVKPANLVLSGDDMEIKVTDFGVAHLADASQTRTGTILGSPSFMSPEQVSGKRLDGRSDLWSLGVSLYQLVSGHLPFTGEPLGTLMYRIANEEAIPVSAWNDSLPDCVLDIIDRAIQKEPGARWQSGRDMAAALRECAARVGKSR
ncbi:MAG: protein kinase [Gammaproteobacteria bacterium]|nr:protein kinase [Gammaproteobacteria bacterium]